MLTILILNFNLLICNIYYFFETQELLSQMLFQILQNSDKAYALHLSFKAYHPQSTWRWNPVETFTYIPSKFFNASIAFETSVKPYPPLKIGETSSNLSQSTPPPVQLID